MPSHPSSPRSQRSPRKSVILLIFCGCCFVLVTISVFHSALLLRDKNNNSDWLLVRPFGARQPFDGGSSLYINGLAWLQGEDTEFSCEEHLQFDFSTKRNGCSITNNNRPHCAFSNFYINPSKIHSLAVAGASLESVMGQSEESEYLHYDPGAFVVETTFDFSPSLNQSDLHHFRHVLSAIQPQSKKSFSFYCNSQNTWNGTTLLVARYEYVNLYHTMTDFWNAYQSMKDLVDNNQSTNVLFLDAHPSGNLDDTWRTLFDNHVDYVQHLSKPTCLSNTRFVPVGYTSPLFPNTKYSCYNATQMKDFVEFVLNKFNLTHVPRIPNRVVVLDRVPYIAHPRSQPQNTERLLSNLGELSRQLSKYNHLDVQVHTMVNLSMQEQITIIRQASFVIANHGAGLTHLVWLQDNALVIELSCDHYFFTELVKWKPTVCHFCQPQIWSEPASNIIPNDYWEEYVVQPIQEALSSSSS